MCTYKDFVSQLKNQIQDDLDTNISLPHTSAFIKAFTKAIKNLDDKVVIPQFGTYTKVFIPAHESRNPATGEIVQVKAREFLKFKASKLTRVDTEEV